MVALVKRLPLEELPADTRPNARQRAEAGAQLAVWLAASECLQRDGHEEIGQMLAQRAVDSAQRQLDSSYTLGMLQEWGDFALRSNDRQRAFELWNEALDHAVKRPVAVKADRLPPITQSQFRSAMAVAKATAETLPELSLRARSEALQAGPPVKDEMPTGIQSRPRVPRPTSSDGLDETARFMGEVAVELTGLVRAWEHAGVAEEETYETLKTIVFCPSRPGEISCIDRPTS